MSCDACPNAGMSNTKTDPSSSYGLWHERCVSVGSPTVTKAPFGIREAMHMWGQRTCGISLWIPLSFAVNLKLV